jgi:UDP-N-acetylglucosamine--N-acetylmuramyl-(pentapeptide) pyrophosphoryl-undecaprenol N-acetylglucosamine transferase
MIHAGRRPPPPRTFGYDERRLASPLRLAVATGPTLGHVHPVLSFVLAYRKAAEVAALVFGPADPRTRALVEDAGLPYLPADSPPWQGASPLGKLRAAARAMQATLWARRHLSRHAAECVVGFGGHVSGPVVLAASSLGAAVAIHEANVMPGMANRWLAPFVHRVFVSQPRSAWAPRADRSVLAGVPLREGFALLAERRRDPPSAGAPLRVLVTSGSRGAGFLARKVPGLVGQLRAAGLAVEIRQQAEPADVEPLREAYARLGAASRIEDYIADMVEACGWAHLAICRAGAGTLAELATAGLPAIVVPLADASEDHQAANGAVYADSGAGLLVRESQWSTDAVAERVRRWSAPADWSEASRRARELARPDASRVMIAECQAMLAGRGAR